MSPNAHLFLQPYAWYFPAKSREVLSVVDVEGGLAWKVVIEYDCFPSLTGDILDDLKDDIIRWLGKWQPVNPPSFLHKLFLPLEKILLQGGVINFPVKPPFSFYW